MSVPPLRVVFTPDSRAVVYDRLAKADFGQRLVFATIADVVQGDKTDELTLPVPEGVIATREDFRVSLPNWGIRGMARRSFISSA
ncbi:hypothetical protein BZL30_4024 [Mycobacterium kansasii]|uniref:Uncharacterized protein n=1 Tax=Mycobacterium kansasii TaxID=1768 RepID=A0A1V3X8P5_MYCKA|nr:hypothetical protein BZL30_4024 [Mycobacterium kansasii]